MPIPPDTRFVFDRFLVGAANRVAAAAARRVAESPGRSYNPLVIHGPAGVGKSHLLVAIGDLTRRMDPDLRVQHEPLATLVDRLSESIASGAVEPFRRALGSMDVLLLDDLEQVAGRPRTQDELVRIWEVLLARGGQLVVTARRPPAEIAELDPRLVAALAAGVAVDIAPADPELRRALVERHLAERGAVLDDSGIAAAAALPVTDVRELRRAVDRVLAAAAAGEAPGPGRVRELLGGAGEGGEGGDEFHDFLADVASVVAEVVETEPWRRQLAQAILRWEGEGLRTRRLEAALEADSAPDVDALLAGFARDAARLREVARALNGATPEDPELLRDPDRLAEAERLLHRVHAPPPPPPAPRPAAPETAPDPWFLDPAKLAWQWIGVEERLPQDVA